VTEMTDRLVK